MVEQEQQWLNDGDNDLRDDMNWLQNTQYKPADSQEAKEDRQFLADVYGLENTEDNPKLNFLCAIYQELKQKGGNFPETKIMRSIMSLDEEIEMDDELFNQFEQRGGEQLLG